MSFVKEIYDNKALLGAKDNFDTLIDIMESNNPNIKVTDNYDRTLLVQFNDASNIPGFDAILAESISSWVGEQSITCPIKYVYNLLPLSATQFILRI